MTYDVDVLFNENFVPTTKYKSLIMNGSKQIRIGYKRNEIEISVVKYNKRCKVCGVEITTENIRAPKRFDKCRSCWTKHVRELRWKSRGISDIKIEELKRRFEKDEEDEKIRLQLEKDRLEKIVEKANLGIDGKCTRCGVLINEENRYKRKPYCRSCFKEPFRVRRHKRRRNFGFSPLNGGFDDSHAHHIDYNYVIHIPIGLHKSVFHKMEDGTGMVSINLAVFLWIAGYCKQIKLAFIYIFSLYLENNMIYLSNRG